MTIEANKKKQERAIKRASIGQIYIKDKMGNVSFINAFDLQMKEGLSLSQFMIDHDTMYADITSKFNDLINSLEDAQFVYPGKQYAVVGLKNGYICNGNGYVVELTVPIEELYKGYCMIESHIVVIDNDMKQKYLDTFKGGSL